MIYRKAIIDQGQCLKDMAIQHCGDATALFEIALLNDVSMTADVPFGTEILLPQVYKQALVDYFADRRLKPATVEPPLQQPPGGIGHMGIGIDFRVS